MRPVKAQKLTGALGRGDRIKHTLMPASISVGGRSGDARPWPRQLPARDDPLGNERGNLPPDARQAAPDCLISLAKASSPQGL